MVNPTRYPNGFTNVPVGNTLQDYPSVDPTTWHTYFNDFDTYNPSEWDEIGTFVASVPDADNGILRAVITGGAGSYQGLLLGESFLPREGKKLIFKTRFKVDNVLTSLLFTGLIQNNSLNQSAYFFIDDDSRALNFAVQSGGTQPKIFDIATIEDDTFYDIGFVYDGESTFSAYVNDKVVGAITDFVLPNSELTLLINNNNGDTGTKTLDVDYIFAAIER